jgi:hypothetical protein
MADFSLQISNYKNYGVYDYKFDDVGNELLNPSSSIFQQVYFSLPFVNVGYDNSKLLSFYDATFKEFIPITGSQELSVFPQEAIDEINAITSDNLKLQNQLQALVNASEQNTGSADVSLVKTTIIALRIQLGQGTTSADFDTVFPYNPIPVELKDSTTATQVVPSSAASTVQPTIITQTSIVSNTNQPGIDESGNPISPSNVGQLSDSELAVISASIPSISATIAAGGKPQFVFVSKDFGSTEIDGVTYYRLVYMDLSLQRAYDIPQTGVGASNTRNLLAVYGTSVHGKYVNVTQDQYTALQKTAVGGLPSFVNNSIGRLAFSQAEFQSILTSVTANVVPVVINGKPYISVPRAVYNFWEYGADYFNNGNTPIQNNERWNGPHMKPGVERWSRARQVGYLGALGPP